MCDIQVKSGFVLNFAKNAYFHNPKNSKDDFNTWYNSKNLKIPKHYPLTLVLKLHGIVSKLNKNISFGGFEGGGGPQKNIWGVIMLFCE